MRKFSAIIEFIKVLLSLIFMDLSLLSLYQKSGTFSICKQKYIHFSRYINFFLVGKLSYLFNISFKDFNWGITFKNFLLILIIYIFYKGLNVISYKEVNILMFDKNNIKNFIFHLIYQCFYPGIFEETLYRGFLVSGLRGLGINENKSNVIQAVIFGASHLNSWGTGFSVFLLHTAFQAIIGYMFGKLYFKTKSLTPCIILHGLFNI